MLQKIKSIPISLAMGLAIGLGGAVPAAAQETVVVEMTQDLTFQPETVTIGVGDTVEWRNTSNLPHTATLRSRSGRRCQQRGASRRCRAVRVRHPERGGS